MLTITILTENRVRRTGLLAEHGLSFWLEMGCERVLFDMGQSDVYVRNADKLGIDLGRAQTLVISHGHYDHGGGLAFFPPDARWPRVFIHPDALLHKFSQSDRSDSPHHPIGFPWRVEELEHLERRLMLNTATMQVNDDMVILSSIPQTNAFETVSPSLLVERNGHIVADDMADEQLLVCDLPQGLIVVVGCSHPGIVNSLEYVRSIFPNRPIHTVIGGMHLEQASPERIEHTIDYFEQSAIQTIIPLHCTGLQATWQMKHALGDRIRIAETGDTISF